MHAGAAMYPSGSLGNSFWTITAGHMPCSSSHECRFSTGGRNDLVAAWLFLPRGDFIRAVCRASLGRVGARWTPDGRTRSSAVRCGGRMHRSGPWRRDARPERGKHEVAAGDRPGTAEGVSPKHERKSHASPTVPARVPLNFCRWRVGLVSPGVRIYLAGVILRNAAAHPARIQGPPGLRVVPCRSAGRSGPVGPPHPGRGADRDLQRRRRPRRPARVASIAG